MLPPKRVSIWFSVRFLCFLGISMFPWPGLGTSYGRAAGALGNLIVGEAPLSSGATLRFDVPVDDQDREGRNEFNTELRAHLGSNALHIPIELRTLTYIPTAVFIALALASPIWGGLRGIIVLLFGLVLLHGFLLISVAVPLLLFFADPTPMKLVELSAPVQWTMNVFYRSLVAPPGMIYAIPIMFWLLMLWLVPAVPVRKKML